MVIVAYWGLLYAAVLTVDYLPNALYTIAMTEKYEQFTPVIERIPTYDSFGDPDEALAWVVDRMISKYQPDGLRVWWSSPDDDLGGMTPEQVWFDNPDTLIASIA